MNVKDNLKLDRYTWAQQTIMKLTDSNSTPVSLFDIGARDEVLKSYCKCNKVNYNGFDLDPINSASRQWDIEYPFPFSDGQADIIAFLEVIEHLNNPWLAVKNLAATLRQNGHLLLTTPNPSWSTSRINLLLRGQLSCFTDNDLKYNHHVFTPWPHIVAKLLADNGLKIIEFVTLDGKTGLFAKGLSPFRFPVQICYRAIKQLIEAADVNSRGMSYAVLAQKL